jgi:three-Cys-motif partner protein
MNAKRSTGAQTHRFGGDWTTAKLDVIARYLESYTTALKDKPSKEHPFVKGYIDAFAGTGYRDARRDERTEDSSQALLLPDLAEAEPQALLDGSARLALKAQPRFDRYVFIERSSERCAQLELRQRSSAGRVARRAGAREVRPAPSSPRPEYDADLRGLRSLDHGASFARSSLRQ